MLYMVELNPVNDKLCNKIFKMIDYNSTPNTVLANFLLDNWENMWRKEYKGLKSFDIIMGNPPYQGTGRKKIYVNFVEKILEEKILNPSKYLILITPKLIFNYLLGITTLQKTQDNFYDLVYFNTSNILK